MKRASPRTLGVVYTPPEIAAPMVRQLLAPLLEGADAAAIEALRICDPAAGEGAFLVEVVAALGTALHAAREREGQASDLAAARAAVATHCIVGVDLDRAALALAAAATGAPSSALLVGDALVMDWAAALPEIFARGGFDAVIANPPYIRQEQVADKAALRGYASYSGSADLYVYFLELAHRILRPGGRYSAIVPTKWRSVAYGRALRTFLAERATVLGIVDLPGNARFPVDAYPCIVWGQLATSAAPIRASRVEAHIAVADALAAPGTPHARARWTAEPWHIDTAADQALLDRLERDFPPLSTVVPERPTRGVVTGYNRAFILDAETRDALLASEPAAAALIRPFVKGRDLRPYRVAPPTRWILLIDRGTDLAPYPALLAHLAQFRTALEPRPATHVGAWSGRKPGPYRWCELQDVVGPLVHARRPRILYQDIQSAPLAALDETGTLVPDTTVWMLPTGDRCLLALLSSPLYGWYAQRRFPPALGGSVRPKLEYSSKLPIAVPTGPDRAALEALVGERGATRPELDDEIADRVAAAYALTPAERALVTASRGPRSAP